MLRHELHWLMLTLLLAVTCVVPAHAAERLVAPDQPGAQDAGPGSAKAPYKTLSYAMSQLQPGDHLIIAAGTYRDALLFPVRTWGSAETLIEGRGRVLVKGSDIVEDWHSLGGSRYAKPWPAEPQQVFINDQALTQIGGTIFGGFPEKAGHPLLALHRTQKGIWPGRRDGDQNNMIAGSFYYDRDNKMLLLQLAPTDRNPFVIEVSVRPLLMSGEKLDRITVKNINFQHSNTSTTLRNGMVTLIGNHLTLDGIHADFADSVGMDLWGDDITIRNSSANYCGQLGLKARGHRIRLINNETSGNNTRGFNKWWEAGGAKFVGLGGLQDSQVSGHRALNNAGDGIWFDWKNRNNVIEHGFFAYNQGMGLQYEASDQAVIVNNIVIGNEQRGIYLPHSSHSVVAFNLVASNHMQGIVIVDEGRRDPEGVFDMSARGNKVFGNIMAWNAAPLVLPTEIADNTSDGNVFIGDAAQTRPGLGWVHMFQEELQLWTTRTQQDEHSLRMENAVDDNFNKSITARNPSPDLAWYEALRSKLNPLPVNPDWLKRVPSVTDFRPGPAL